MGRRSLLRHPRLAQAGEVSGFKQGSDFRHPEISDGLQAGDARIPIIAAQPAGFSKLGDGTFSLTVEGIGGSEVGMKRRSDPAWRRVPSLARGLRPRCVIA